MLELKTIGVAGLTLLSLVASGSPTHGDSDHAEPMQVCAIGVEGVPIDADELHQPSPSPEVNCFLSFARAFEFVTGIQIDPATISLSMREVSSLLEEHPEAARRDTLLLGIAYEDINEGGDTLLHYGTGPCVGVTFGFPSLSGGWDDRISSASQFNSCWGTYYELTGYDTSGNRINCPGYCASMSTMNDRTSSIVFRPVGTYG